MVVVVHRQHRILIACIELIGGKRLHRRVGILQMIAEQIPVKGQVQVRAVAVQGARILPNLVRGVTGGAGDGVGKGELIDCGIRLVILRRHLHILLFSEVDGP